MLRPWQTTSYRPRQTLVWGLVVTIFFCRFVEVYSEETAIAEETVVVPPGEPSEILTSILKLKIDVSYRNASLQEVLTDLDARFQLTSISSDLTELDEPLTLEAQQVPVPVILGKLSNGSHLSMEFHGDKLLIWQSAPDGVIADLTKKLNSKDPELRYEAVYELTRLCDPTIYPLLAPVLDGTDLGAKIYAVRGLYKYQRLHWIYTPSAPVIDKALLAILDDPRATGCRFEAAGLLAAGGSKRAVEFLLPYLKIPDEWIATAAAKAIAPSSDPRVAPLIKLSPNSSSDPAFFQTMALCPDPKMGQVFIGWLSYPNPITRLPMITAAAIHRHEPEVLDHLLEALAPKTTQSYAPMFDALGPFRDTRTIAELLKVVKKKESAFEDRQQAMRALGRRHLQAADEAILDFWHDRTWGGYALAFEGIATSRSPQCLQEIANILKAPTPTGDTVRAIYAIPQFHLAQKVCPNPQILTGLIRLLDSNKSSTIGWDGRDSVCIALLSLGDPRALDAVRDQMKPGSKNPPHSTVYKAYFELLFRKNDPRLQAILLNVFQNPANSEEISGLEQYLEEHQEPWVVPAALARFTQNRKTSSNSKLWILNNSTCDPRLNEAAFGIDPAYKGLSTQLTDRMLWLSGDARADSILLERLQIKSSLQAQNPIMQGLVKGPEAVTALIHCRGDGALRLLRWKLDYQRDPDTIAVIDAALKDPKSPDAPFIDFLQRVRLDYKTETKSFHDIADKP